MIPNEDSILAERKKTSRGESRQCLTNKVNNNGDCLKKNENDIFNNIDLDWYCKYFSSCDKIVRMMAWIKRFMYKANHLKLTGELTAQEIYSAEKCLIKLVQTESFTSKEDKRLATLEVYEDEQGLLRLKTEIVFK